MSYVTMSRFSSCHSKNHCHSTMPSNAVETENLWKLHKFWTFTLNGRDFEKTECETMKLMKLKKLVLSLLFLFARLSTIRWILVAHIGKFLHTLHEHAFHSQLEVGGGHHSRNSSDSLSNQELSSPPDQPTNHKRPATLVTLPTCQVLADLDVICFHF